VRADQGRPEIDPEGFRQRSRHVAERPFPPLVLRDNKQVVVVERPSAPLFHDGAALGTSEAPEQKHRFSGGVRFPDCLHGPAQLQFYRVIHLGIRQWRESTH